MRKAFLLIFFAGIINSQGQELSSYKYVLIPGKYEFLKEADQYQLNSLTKFLFEKYGFETYVEGEGIPGEYLNNRCEGLFANVENNSGMLRTRLRVTLKDCNNRQVFISEEGVSKEKDYRNSYQEALRKAFESIPKVNNPVDEVIVTAQPQISEPVLSGNSVEEVTPGSFQEETNTSIKKEAGSYVFEKDKIIYNLKKTKEGYGFYQNGMEEPFASLIESSSGNVFIYNSITSKGMARFDNTGNLIVEVVGQDGALQTVIYNSRN
ncbi:hypothetical protein BH23BAC2_BH23BAC2_16620 [soil metagenome]